MDDWKPETSLAFSGERPSTLCVSDFIHKVKFMLMTLNVSVRVIIQLMSMISEDCSGSKNRNP